MYHAPLAITSSWESTQMSKRAISSLIGRKNEFSGVILMIREVSLVLAWKSSAACNGVWYMNDGQDLLYFSSFWHWHGALCITFVLRWTTRVVCSLWDPELSSLDACEVRETPVTWRSTTGALAYLSLFIMVRRAKAKWPRPQGPVVWVWIVLWFKFLSTCSDSYPRVATIHSGANPAVPKYSLRWPRCDTLVWQLY